MHRYFEINGKGHNVRCKIYFQDLKLVERVVIFGHGFGGHKDNGAAEKFANRLISKYKKFAVITFNWPSHGDDVKKKLKLEDCSDYLELVIDHVRQKYTDEEIYSYATSFGGYLTLKYIYEHGNPFRKISLRCPAVNMYDVLTSAIMSAGELEALQKGQEVPVGFDRKVLVTPALLEDLKANDIRQWDFLDYAEQIDIIHGSADEIVPHEAAYAFADDNCITFFTVEGADHRFQRPDKMEQAVKRILEFYDL